MKIRMRAEKISNYLFIFLIVFVALFILRSRPFMKIPYDIWDHLMTIVSVHDTGEAFTFMPGIRLNQVLWHYVWGYFFRLIPFNDVFIWAKIIHVLQSLFAFVCYFAFAYQALVLLFRDVPRPSLRPAAFLATVLWVLGTGTFSMFYQQAWIQWYSVNYQGFTMPLYWLSMSQLLLVVYGDLPRRAVIERGLLLILFFLIILVVHPMESIFFAITVGIILLINIPKIISFGKRHPLKTLTAVFLVTGLPLSVAFLAKELSLIRFPLFYEGPSVPLLILKATFVNGGRAVVEQGLNRGWAAFSEMAFFCLCCAPLLWVMVIFKKRKAMLSCAVLFFLTIHSLAFFLIPRVFWMAGIASVLTNASVVHRFNFICSAFIFLPALLLLFFENSLWRSLYVFLGCFAAAMACFFLSQTMFHGTFYGNVQSLWKSLELRETDRVGVQFSEKDLKWLERIYLSNLPPNTGKPFLFYVRGDVAPLFRTIFRQMVFADRRLLPSREEFLMMAKVRNFTPVEVDLPEGYPKDAETFRGFSLEKH